MFFYGDSIGPLWSGWGGQVQLGRLGGQVRIPGRLQRAEGGSWGAVRAPQVVVRALRGGS